MSKITIIEGNSNDKDNIRAYMVKGEKGADGVSPTVEVERVNNEVFIDITDAEGTKSAVMEDGVSPTVTTSKTGGVTTVTITDIDGTHTATINDGETYEVPTNSVIGWSGTSANIPGGYEETDPIPVVVDEYSTSINDTYSANYVNSLFGDIQYPTYANGTDISSTRRTYYHKIGKRVFVDINATMSLSANAYVTIFNLPEGYRPKYEVYTVGVRSGYDTYVNLYVNPNGAVGIFSTTAITDGNMAGEISFYVE